MLIDFRVENHRSVRDEQALTMEVGRGGDPDDVRPRKPRGHPVPLLPAAALFGANASGKSNVLSALAFMRGAVVHSHRAWSPERGVPREPFAWGLKAAEPSLFEVTVLIGGVRHAYGFVVDDREVCEEWLFAWPTGRKQVWFEREGKHFKFGLNLRGKNRVVEKVTRPNALFLSVAAQHGHAQLRAIFEWFARIQAVNVARRGRRPPDPRSERWLLQVLGAAGAGRQTVLFGGPDTREGIPAAFRRLIEAADVGIVDLKVVEDENPPGRNALLSAPRPRVLVLHESDRGEAWLPLEEESQGTLTLFRMGPALLEALELGALLLVDELEASLHPLLAQRIVEQFNDPRTNPRDAQIVFTTHDTSLLGSPLGTAVLRRDQVWFTEKDRGGATTLRALTEFKPRKAENAERGYLHGRYGAVPHVGALARIDR